MGETRDGKAKLTEYEERFMLDLLGYGPDWIGQKNAIANRLIERGLVRGSAPRGRQINVDLTEAGRSLLRSLQSEETSNGRS